jgi:esterase
MELFFRKMGSGDPVIILHGLYGSSDNWYAVGRALGTSYTVYIVDQRNHGNSPHDPDHSYKAMTGDLYAFMQQHGIGKAVIMGHSMGGKTALAFGLRHPEMIKKMIAVDISPVNDPSATSSLSDIHLQIISALQKINPELISDRQQADAQLAASIPSAGVRQFLLKSLKRTVDGKFKWSLNIPALAENMTTIFENVIHEDSTDPRSIPEFPLLFIKGERSDYISQYDENAIKHLYPWAEFAVIPNSGHWVHAEQPEVFLNVVRAFLEV